MIKIFCFVSEENEDIHMNITNLEITQATIDMFFCLVCVIMVVSIKANNPNHKEENFKIKPAD